MSESQRHRKFINGQEGNIYEVRERLPYCGAFCSERIIAEHVYEHILSLRALYRRD